MTRITFGLLVLGLALFAHGQDEERFSLMAPRENPLQLPTQAAVTWARPLAGGSIEVFAVSPEYTRGDFDGLADRLEIELDWLPAWSRTMAAANDDAAQEFVRRLNKGLHEKPDVVVLGNLDLGMLPDAWLEELGGYVAAGGGVLLSQVRGEIPAVIAESLQPMPDPNAQAVARGLAEGMTPEWDDDLECLSAGICGEGRAVRLDFAQHSVFQAVLPALTDAFLAEEAYRETYYALVARAVVWAARRGPKAAIAGVESTAIEGPQEEEIPPNLPPEYVQAMKDSVIHPLVHPFVGYLSAPAPERYSIRAQVRVPGRDLQLAWPLTATVGKGDTAFHFAVPVGIGRCFLDVWLYDTGREARVVDWFSKALVIEGWPSITKFQCSKSIVNTDDSVEVSVEVPPQLRRMAESTMSGQIVVRATDVYKRIVAEKRETLTAEGGQFRVMLDFVELPGNRLKIEVFASDRPGASFAVGSLHNTAYDYTYLTVGTPSNVSLRLVAQGPAAEEYVALPLLARLRDLGFDSVAGPENVGATFMASQENVRIVPQIDLLETEGGRACPNDPKHWQATMASLSGIPGAYASMGIQNFFVDASAAGHDRSACRFCVDALREYLRGAYGELAALNDAWQSAYRAWDDVRFPEGKGDADSWAPYVDVRRFEERMLGNACILGQAGLQSGTPSARVGTVLSANDPVRDVWFFATQLNALTVPQDPVMAEKLRSYRIAHNFAAMSSGANGSAAYSRWLPWNAVFNRMSAVWLTDVYTGSGRGAVAPALNPSWEPSDSLHALAAQTAYVRRGLATVLAQAERESYGIAMYDSPVSGDIEAAAQIWYTDRRESELAFVHILESLGYQFDFVCRESLEEGVLAEYRVLVLPAVSSLSDDEISTIQSFHQGGGVLIADVLPGRYDEHGRRRAAVPMAELFGVVSDGAGEPLTLANADAPLPAAVEPVAVPLRDLRADGSVHAAGDAERSIWVYRNEPAPALLLNHRVDAGVEDATARAINAVLDAEGFLPAANPLGKKDRRFDGEVVRWTYGPAHLVGLLRRPDAGDRAKFDLNLHLEGYVYDLGTGTLLRKPEKTEVELEPGGVAMFSALPYEVTRLEIQAASTKLFPGQRLRVAVAVKTDEALPEKHVVWVDLVDAQGKVLEQYSRGVVCAGGLGEVRLPLVLNEDLGFYTVRARDVLTGMEASARIEIALP